NCGRSSRRDLCGSRWAARKLLSGSEAYLAASILADIFLPQVGFVANEFLHECDAVLMLENVNLDAACPEQVFVTHEGLIFSNDYSRDFIQQDGAGTHGTG